SAAEGEVLIADTVYEARLVPLLLHEDFTTYPAGSFLDSVLGHTTLGPWAVRDEGTSSFGHWEVIAHPKLNGSLAAASAATVTLDPSADLSNLDSDFDVLILAGDTARPSR